MQKNNINSLIDFETDESELYFFEVNILDEKDFSMFIKKCEFLCRKTQEYTVWSKKTKRMANVQNPDPEKNDACNCPICGIDYEYANAESHHHPITLFNLCVNKFQYWINENLLDDRVPLDLVQEVMADHMINNIEHIVLCKHCHEKYHNGEINVKNYLDKIIEYKRQFRIENSSESSQEMLKEKELKYKRKREQKDKIFFESGLGDAASINSEKINEELKNFINSIDEKELR